MQNSIKTRRKVKDVWHCAPIKQQSEKLDPKFRIHPEKAENTPYKIRSGTRHTQQCPPTAELPSPAERVDQLTLKDRCNATIITT